MTRTFRTALMWLLLLALPLQGFAAASMINCGPNHQRMSAAAKAQPAVAHHHAVNGHHRHGIGAAGGHDETALPAIGENGAASVHHLDTLMKFKCSACATCCIGAALLADTVTIEPFPPAKTPDSCVPTAHVRFVTDGPDRPPRPFLV